MKAPSHSTINESAVEWLSRQDKGFVGDESRTFQAWLAADPQHAAALRALEPTWAAVNRLRHTGSPESLRDKVAAVLAAKRRRRLAGTAGSLAAAAAIAFAFFLVRPTHPPAPTETVALRPDQQTLPDGSIIQLNAGAEIDVAFTPELRTIHLLKGEALFEVAHNKNRPFIVDAGTIAVRAVGTAFTVRRAGQEVGILVTEGKVAVERTPAPVGSTPALSSPEAVFVSAGGHLKIDLAVASTLPAPQMASAQEQESELAWRNRRVEFSGTPLSLAVEYFNRGNAIKLGIGSPGTGELRISGVFWTDDPEAFSRNLEASLGLKASQVGGGNIVLEK